VLPWSSREALFEELRSAESVHEVGRAFEDAGTSAPVLLTQEQKGGLIEIIEVWAGRVEGGPTAGLPAGISELRNALYDDLHDGSGD
jgi:hypothetical protein